jgi:drug/metabolite transporter (DMT)-like permease
MTALIAPARQSLLWANLVCALSMIIWAAGLPAADLVIPIIPPFALTALRCGLAGLVLLAVWAAVEGINPIRCAHWGRGIAVGGIGIGLAAVCLVVGQAYTDPVTVGIITASMPLIGMGLEVALDGRRITRALVVGMTLSLVGGMVALAHGKFPLDLGLGALATFGSCLFYTWGSRVTVTAFPTLTDLGRTTITICGGAIAATVAAVLAQTTGFSPSIDWSLMGLREWGALAVFALLSLALMQVLWIISVARIGIGASSLHMNAVPFYVMSISFLMGGAWSNLQLGGAALVVLGVMIAQGFIGGKRA